jgi:subtilase family serine protease
MRAALLSFSNFAMTRLLTVTICTLIFSTVSFAEAPDRILARIDSNRGIGLAKSLHPKAKPQYDQGAVDPSQRLSYITLLLSPSVNQQRALNQLLAQQQDPKSPNYHNWLTPQQYADRFGLSQNDLNKVTSWLRSYGFEVLSVGGGRNSVIFRGTVFQAQNAFGTEIHNYVIDGQRHFANSTPVIIPAELQGIVTTVVGFHDFRPQPANGGRRFVGLRNGRPDYYDGNFFFPNFLAPDDLATIYDIAPLYSASTPIDGTGQKLAIVGQTDIYLADINDFRSGFGLSTIPTSGSGACTTNVNGIIVSPCSTPIFDYVLVGSDPGVPSAGDLGESDLDIEWSGAVARNAQIVFVNGETAGGVNDALIAAINPPSGPPLAPVVSMSYGICEAEAFDMENLLQQGSAEGVTVVNSSGDAGSATCDGAPNSALPFKPAHLGLAVSYPASSPEVTGVGGTGISLANDSFPNPSPFWSTTLGVNGGTALSYIPELAWNDDEQLALFCQVEFTIAFCKNGGAVSGWVPLTSTATAKQVQSDIWISQGGGGASNCFAETAGGICQAGFPQPAWQQGLAVPGAPAGVRYVPDVSLLSSPDFPGYIWCTPESELNEGGTTSTCAGGIFAAIDTFSSIVGGTSASAPVFAGIVTLLNQYVVANGFQTTPGLGNVNPNLYQIATFNPSAFHQVTAGDNMVYCQPGTPAGQPSAIVCPASGVFGYQASNADSATGYNLVTGLGSVDANNLVTAWGELLTTSTISISRSAANIIQGQTETLTITVTPSSASGVVSLSVTNNSSTTSLGNINVSAGTGTFTTNSLAVGANSITGSYVGTNKSSTSSAAVVTVAAPAFTWATSGGTSHTVLAGQTTLAYNFVATPVGTTTFTTPVTFGCALAPADATVACVFSPTSIAAGSGATPVSMTITTAGPNTGAGTLLKRRAANRAPWLPLTLPIAGIFMLGILRGRARNKLSRGWALVLCGLSLALLGVMVACGGGSTPTPVSVTVTPATAKLYANEAGNAWPVTATQQQFSATVNNSTNTAVTWSVAGGNANGTVSSTGLYTAPTAVPSPAAGTVIATAAADSSKSGSGVVQILTPTTLGTFNVTVTATAGVTPHGQTVALTVQ